MILKNRNSKLSFNHYNRTDAIKGLKADCQDLLYKTNREIKSLNYKLNRIINSEDCHTVLHPNRMNEIEILEQT